MGITIRIIFRAAIVALSFSSIAGASPFVSVCDRIPAMQVAILQYLPPSSGARALDCHQVTQNDLAQIDNFGGTAFPLAGPERVRPRDLQGLARLSYLTLSFAPDYSPQILPASFSTPIQIPDGLFLETPSLGSLRIRYASIESPGQVLSGPIRFSSDSFKGLGQLKNLEIEAASVNLNREMLAPLSSLQSFTLAELKDLPSELDGKVGVTPRTFKPAELSATGIFSRLSSLQALTVSKNSPPPVLAPADETLAVGWRHSCALRNSTVTCWGDNSHGQTNVPALDHPTQIAADGLNTCAVTATGVKCWGDDSKGQKKVPALDHPTQVVIGWDHICALAKDGVTCWGDNTFLQSKVPSLDQPRMLTAQQTYTCALSDDGVNCWGSWSDRQKTVAELKGLEPGDLNEISGGVAHLCVRAGSEVRCWGSAESTQVPLLNRPTQIAAGFYHTCALTADGVRCWGVNHDGQTSVPPLNQPTQIASGTAHSCAVTADGIKCWGFNDSGQCSVPKGF